MLCKIKESHYPASTSAKPVLKSADRYGHNSSYHNKKHDGYIARLANVKEVDSLVREEQHPNDDWNPDYKYDEGYFLGVMNTAD